MIIQPPVNLIPYEFLIDDIMSGIRPMVMTPGIIGIGEVKAITLRLDADEYHLKYWRTALSTPIVESISYPTKTLISKQAILSPLSRIVNYTLIEEQFISISDTLQLFGLKHLTPI